MTRVLLGIFVTDMTFFFRIIDTHSSQLDCLYAAELLIQEIGKPLRNYNVVCVPVDGPEGQTS